MKNLFLWHEMYILQTMTGLYVKMKLMNTMVQRLMKSRNMLTIKMNKPLE